MTVHGASAVPDSRVPRRLRHLAAVLLLLAVAWSPPAGRIGEDTKNDLFVDPWGLMVRALHLWDPQVTWGTVQNQGYGYLFPMGPFFAGVGALVPMWITQRLWWSLLLVAGYAGAAGLLRALGVGTPVTRSVAALGYALAPRVVSSLGGLSSEAHPQLLAPAVLLPVVLATSGRLGPRRGAALSGAALLCCGGVNATATAFAALPTLLWLLTRRRWWRSPVTWWWGGCAVLATAWFVGPLLLLGRYAPPFLGWIENAEVVSRPVGLLDVVRGTSHWLGHVVVAGGPWWPAGWELVSSPTLILATTVLAAAALVGIACSPTHRLWTLSTLTLGVLLLALPHSGALSGPLTGQVQDLLDGPLVPLRNIHKADPLVRLPLMLGLARVLELCWALRRSRPRLARWSAPVAAVLVLVTAGPGITLGITTRGTFTGMPSAWRDAGAWLDAHPDGRSLLVPASTFGEYVWGRTIDEPIRALTGAEYAVRDGIPLTPAGTIRFLDEIELRMRTGRSIAGAADSLRAVGVRYLVLRNDLDRSLTGGLPTAVTRSSLELSPGLERVAAFGRPDAGHHRHTDLAGRDLGAPGDRRCGPLPLAADRVPLVSGAAEALPALRDTGLVGGPVVFDSDVEDVAEWSGNERVETDSLRARERYFGAVRGQDVTSGLDALAAAGADDFLPALTSASFPTTVSGARVEASGSVATTSRGGTGPRLTSCRGLRRRPDDGVADACRPRRSSRPPVRGARSLAGLRLTPLGDHGGSPPTKVSVSNGRQWVVTEVRPEAVAQSVGVPGGPTAELWCGSWTPARVPRVDDDRPGRGDPPRTRGARDGRPARARPGRTDAVVITRQSGAFPGCVLGTVWRCLTGATTDAEERCRAEAHPDVVGGSDGVAAVRLARREPEGRCGADRASGGRLGDGEQRPDGRSPGGARRARRLRRDDRVGTGTRRHDADDPRRPRLSP